MDDLSINSGLANRLWRVALWGSVVAILIAPLVAMQFTGEVHWTPFDFAVAAALLGATALAGYHGWLMAQSEGWLEGDSLSGLLALAMMAYLSVAGVLLWRRLPPDWVSRSLRKRARLAHVQRGVTVLLLVALALHLG